MKFATSQIDIEGILESFCDLISLQRNAIHMFLVYQITTITEWGLSERVGLTLFPISEIWTTGKVPYEMFLDILKRLKYIFYGEWF